MVVKQLRLLTETEDDMKAVMETIFSIGEVDVEVIDG